MEEKKWLKLFDERQRKEVAFAGFYTWQYGHGTDGHHRLVLISRMAELIDVLLENMTPEQAEEALLKYEIPF